MMCLVDDSVALDGVVVGGYRFYVEHMAAKAADESLARQLMHEWRKLRTLQEDDAEHRTAAAAAAAPPPRMPTRWSDDANTVADQGAVVQAGPPLSQ